MDYLVGKINWTLEVETVRYTLLQTMAKLRGCDVESWHVDLCDFIHSGCDRSYTTRLSYRVSPSRCQQSSSSLALLFPCLEQVHPLPVLQLGGQWITINIIHESKNHLQIFIITIIKNNKNVVLWQYKHSFDHIIIDKMKYIYGPVQNHSTKTKKTITIFKISCHQYQDTSTAKDQGIIWPTLLRAPDFAV